MVRPHAVILGLVLLSLSTAKAQDVKDWIAGDNADASAVEPPPDSRVQPVLLMEYRLDDIYRERHGGKIWTSVQQVGKSMSLTVPFVVGQLQPQLRLSFHSTSLDVDFHPTDDQEASYRRNNEIFGLNYAMQLGGMIRVGGEVSHSADGLQNMLSYGATIRFALAKSTSIAIRAGSWSNWEFLQISVPGIQGVAPLDFQRRGIEVTWKFPVRDISVEVQTAQAILSSVPDVQRDVGTRFLPSGTLNEVKSIVILPMGSAWESSFSFHRRQVLGDARFVSGYSSYGSLEALSYKERGYAVSLRRLFGSGSSFSVDMQFRACDGSASGYVEGWPFKSLLESMVSGREFFRALGSLRLWKVHLGAAFPTGNFLSLAANASVVHAVPEFEYESWEPKFLVFGVQNYTRNVLPVRRADALVLSVGVAGSVGDARIQYSLDQVIPLRIERNNGSVQTGSGSGEVPGNSEGTSTDGGRFHRITLTHAF